MLVNTQGIVLNTILYSDSSVIAKLYTRSSGLKSLMIRTGKGKSAQAKMSLLQPLTLVNLSFDKSDKKGLRTPRSFERTKPFKAIPFDTFKTCIALFMAEVVARAIGEEETNLKLFSFLENAILLLDEEENSVNNFHLKFMIEFSSHLGFLPDRNTSDKLFFDLVEGEFTNSETLHPYVIRESELQFFNELIQAPFSEHYVPRPIGTDRKQLLQHLVDYYRLHLEGMKEITSHKILEEVMA
jgi:DNA repair protein RecO (recombination protein O)